MTLRDLTQSQIDELQRRAVEEFTSYARNRKFAHYDEAKAVALQFFSNGLKAGLEFAQTPFPTPPTS